MPHSEQEQGEYMNKGTIRCARRTCGKERKEPVCPHCGNTTCYIHLYWKGEVFKYRHYKDEFPFDFIRARDFHSTLRLRMNDKSKKFDPREFLSARFTELKFKNQFTKWILHLELLVLSNELSDDTLRAYRSYGKNHILPYFENFGVRDIELIQLDGFCDNLRDKPSLAKIKTRRDILNTLHRFFDWMYHKGAVISFPPWPTIGGNNSVEKQALDEDAQEYGLQSIPERHRDIIEFGMRTGRRPNELVAIQVHDLETQHERLEIRRTWGKRGYRENVTKQGNEPIYAALDERAIEIAEKNSRGKLPGAFLFINPDNGKPYRPDQPNDIWKEYSGLPGITFYEASRHSFCTQIGQIEGVTLRDQQDAMGHKTMQATMKYNHKSVKKIADILRKKAEVKRLRKAKSGTTSAREFAVEKTGSYGLNNCKKRELGLSYPQGVEPAVRIELTDRQGNRLKKLSQE